MNNGWSTFLDWIEKHPTFSSIVAGVVVTIIGGVVYWIWTASREKVNIKITIRAEQFKLSTVGDERLLVYLKFRIKILNHSIVPVCFQDFYLDLPVDAIRTTNEFGLPMPIVGVHFDKGARMYAGSFHLKDGDGKRMLAGFSLDSPVTYLYSELEDHFLLENLRGKHVTFVVIDQNEKEHFSNRYHLTDKNIIHSLLTR